jgi:hypothetical protein
MGTLFGAQGQTAIYLNDGTNYSFRVNGAAGSDLITNLMPRDPSAWYHLVVACDTTQATEANRLKIYVNGNQQTSFQVGSAYPTLNGDTYFNSTALHTIGRRSWNSDQQFDGYMTDINFIDGQALEPYYFGNNDANGVWKPIKYTGTYGTNGFYLTFGNTTSTTTLGYDTSGNNNNWTTNNISLTAGTTYDAMLDVPTNTSATVANYCVLNPTIRQLSGSVTEGNLRGAGSSYECWGTMAFPSTGKYYFEFTNNSSTGAGNGPAIGIVGLNPPDENYGVKYNRNGTKWLNGTNSIAYGASYTTGDVIGVAYDADNNSVVFYKNNVSQGATTTTSGYTYLPYQFDNSGNGGFLNFGQRPFTYTPPTGFVRLNTFNLPTPTILQGNRFMDATLYTGNGANTSITNAGLFRPDLVWGQARSAAYGSWLYDAVRGATKQLETFGTNAESTQSTMVTAFNSNGFNIGTDTAGNQSGITYVAWQWQAGSSTVTNTSGSISSQVRANTTTGFSVVTYTGTGANATVGHGLGVAPKMIFTRYRGTESWSVYHTSLGGTKTLYLNLTNAANTTSLAWNNTDPTSTVFSVGSAGTTNTSGSPGMVAYCWAEIAGFSKFGSYTGNGSTDGPFIYLGFRPKFVLIKRTDSGNNWVMEDSSRSPFNVVDDYLAADSSQAESTTSQVNIDFLSNGFKLRSGFDIVNAGTYIYMAFAENPTKISNAR